MKMVVWMTELGELCPHPFISVHSLFSKDADTHMTPQQLCNKFLSSIQNRAICYTTVSPGPGAHKDHLGDISFLMWMFRPHTRSQTTQMVAPAPVFS